MKNSRRSVLIAAGAAGALAGGAMAGTKSTVTKTAAPDTEKFRQAVLAGDLATVSAMLDRDPALRYARDAEGVSMYTLASLHGQPKIAEELVRRGIQLDIFEATVSGNSQRATELAKDDAGVAHHRLPDGRTPLHLATEAGRQEMAIFFTMRGADLSAGPESPLLAAVDHRDRAAAREMSRFLLMNGSNANARRRDGKSALELAIAHNDAELAEALIHRGADPAAAGVNALVGDAASIERVHFGRRYTQGLRGNPVTREDTYGLPQEFINQFVSVAHFDFERVKKLQKLCPTLIMTRATWDELAIEAAAHMGLQPMAQFLADLGAPVSTCTATLLGAADLVKRLVREDPASIRERGAHDIALLAYTAFASEQAGIAEFLLDAGANVHARSLGQTCLHLAAAKGHLDLAKLFLERGADINATAKVRNADVTPLGMAVQAKQERMTEFLRSRGGRG